ncbi:Zn(II)2Cys6 transcription factor [Sporobolomyces salmoneus]|uniref:Zn(II)2Cys6 transcription factor n=1 Tax=Sporobolomyces salmoneus TaxID=183962 RepID=UPI0031741A2E
MEASLSDTLDVSGEPQTHTRDQLPEEEEEAAFAPPPASKKSATPTTATSTTTTTKKSTKRAAIAGAEEEDEEGKAKKRNRKPVTCAQCRRRKLKCDRGYPCGACRDRQEAHLCEWEGAIRLPQPNLTRDAEALELRGQLDRFETLLNSLAAGTPGVSTTSAGGETSNGTGPSAVPSGGGGFSAAVAGSSNGAVGTSDSGVSRTLSQLSQPNATPAKIANTTTRTQLLHNDQSVGHLVGLLPSRRELDILVARFLASEPNFLPVVHVPSFQQRYKTFSHSTATEQPFLLAFLLSIVSYEMGWQITDSELSKTAGVQKENAMKRLFEAASETLRMAGFLEAPNLDVIRTLVVLYHVAVQQLDTRSGYLLTQAIQVAQTLGLNRDPSKVGITDLIETEERRRLWYILVAFDSLDQPGRLSIISPDQYDTERPASAYDHEITREGITLRPFPTFTPALYLELVAKLGEYNSLISQSFFSIQPKEPIMWQKIVDSNEGLDRLKSSYPALTWKNGLVEPLSEDSFASDRFRVLAHTAVLKLEIRVNRPFLTRGYVDPRFQAGRTRCLDAAHQLLGIWLAYRDQSQVSRLWQLAFHGLNAICIIAIDLYQDPKGPRAESHRRFLAMSSGRLDRPEFKSRISQEIMRIVNCLVKNLSNVPPAYTPSSTTLDPTEEFAVSSLPVPLTIDPFAYISPSSTSNSSEEREPELTTLWHEIIASYPSIYGIPDKREWEELSKKSGRWKDGIDLISLEDQAVDQLDS